MKRLLLILIIIPFFQAGQTQPDTMPVVNNQLDTVAIKALIQPKADSAARHAAYTIDSICRAPVRYKRGPIDVEKRVDGRVRKWIGIFKIRGRDTIGYKTVIKQIQ